ncbi:MAG: hypothetical protein PHD61_08155 [Bacteroidales bacterium]|nr:hypothetical protein [Lentimicrobiaceae bacterium]MDD5695263.1 hypothetical protein [Bacteroidales bacterium]
MNFAMQDMIGFMENGGGKGGSDRPISTESSSGEELTGQGDIGRTSPGIEMIGQLGGIATAHSLGLNLTASPGHKLDIAGSYFLNISDNKTDQELRREYFSVPGHSSTYKEIRHSDTFNQNHRLNLKLTYSIDSSNTLIYVPTFNYQGYKVCSVSFMKWIMGFQKDLINQPLIAI